MREVTQKLVAGFLALTPRFVSGIYCLHEVVEEIERIQRGWQGVASENAMLSARTIPSGMLSVRPSRMHQTLARTSSARTKSHMDGQKTCGSRPHSCGTYRSEQWWGKMPFQHRWHISVLKPTYCQPPPRLPA